MLRAKAKQVPDMDPSKLTIECNGNIVKNVNGTVVPNSNRMNGVVVAAVLGMVGGDATRQLKLLEGIDSSSSEKTKLLISQGFCSCHLVEGAENLYICVVLGTNDSHTFEVLLRGYHTNITHIEKDGKVLLDSSSEPDVNSKRGYLTAKYRK